MYNYKIISVIWNYIAHFHIFKKYREKEAKLLPIKLPAGRKGVYMTRYGPKTENGIFLCKTNIAI